MAAQVATRAASAAGFLCNGDPSSEVLSGVLESLVKTSTIKSEALHFAVGEALCFAFGGTRWHNCPFPCILYVSNVLSMLGAGEEEGLAFTQVPDICEHCAGLSVGADSVLYSDYRSLAEVQKAAEAEEAETMSSADPMQALPWALTVT